MIVPSALLGKLANLTALNRKNQPAYIPNYNYRE